ncbi:MAG: sugar transferase [Dehalococcoidia bacterium]|nr:sugar transferase [Dehalococcoidia bacterium]
MDSSRARSRLVMVGVDFLAVNLAFVAAYLMRYVLEIGRGVAEGSFVAWTDFLPIQFGMAAVLTLSNAASGIYNRNSESILDDASAILGATSVGAMFTLAVVFMTQGYAYSRLLFIYAWLISFGLLLLTRSVRQAMLSVMRSKGIGLRNVLVVGGDQLGKMVMNLMASEPGRGYRAVGFLCDVSNGDYGRFKWLGPVSNLGEVLRHEDVDEVFIAAPAASRGRVMDITVHCQREQVPFKIVPDLFEMSLSGVDINDLGGIPLISMRESSIQGVNLFLKRAMDLSISVLVLLVTSPILLLVALAIKLDSRGPVLFTQERLGRCGKPFKIYKFRSMKAEAEKEVAKLVNLNEAEGPLFKIREDPRLTRVGRWLRRVSLDELPQLFNVLKGDMALVGPRPPLASEVGLYQEWHRKRLEAAPGVTGLWQVSGRSELPFDEMVMLDIYYIENWSPGLDAKILLRTLPAVLSGRGAY